MTFRHCAAAMIALSLAAPAAAQPLDPPEAVALLLFSQRTTALPKTTGPGRVVYRGEGPERIVLSIAQSRADPCLFEALFFEAPTPALAGSPAAPAAMGYAATIDLRKPGEAALRPPAAPAGEGRLTLRGKDLYCARNVMLEAQLTYEERCLDSIDDRVTPEAFPRISAAFEAMRRACRW